MLQENVTIAFSEAHIMNPIKFWQVIKDDSKKTFEVIDQTVNTNAFTNKTYAMQRDGMDVSCITPPVGGKLSSKDQIKITGYTKEIGLYERLLKRHYEITIGSIDIDAEDDIDD